MSDTTLVTFVTFDPVEGDMLTTFQDPTNPTTGAPITGAAPVVTCKIPDGTVLTLSATEPTAGHYEASIDTTTHGGGNYIFRWKFSGAYVGAIEYKVKVLRSKVLN